MRIQQPYVSANDFKQIFHQKNNSVDTTGLRIYKGNVGIGNTDPGTYKLNVTGNINTSGTLTTTGEIIVSGNKLVVKSGPTGDPTLHFRHSSNRTAFIHKNSNLFYILSCVASVADTEDNWGIVANGRWPLEINLTNNNAVFGGNVNCTSLNSTGYIYDTGTIQSSGNYYFQHDLWHLDNQVNNRFYFAGGSTSYWSGNFQGNFSPAHEFRLGLNQSTIGALYNNGNFIISSYSTYSDRRIKKDIEEINDDEVYIIINSTYEIQLY